MIKYNINLNDELMKRIVAYVSQSKEYAELLQNLGKTKDEKLFKLALNSFIVNSIQEKVSKVEPKKPVQKEVV